MAGRDGPVFSSNLSSDQKNRSWFLGRSAPGAVTHWLPRKTTETLASASPRAAAGMAKTVEACDLVLKLKGEWILGCQKNKRGGS